jgi:hypothetical protein
MPPASGGSFGNPILTLETCQKDLAEAIANEDFLCNPSFPSHQPVFSSLRTYPCDPLSALCTLTLEGVWLNHSGARAEEEEGCAARGGREIDSRVDPDGLIGTQSAWARGNKTFLKGNSFL